MVRNHLLLAGFAKCPIDHFMVFELTMPSLVRKEVEIGHVLEQSHSSLILCSHCLRTISIGTYSHEIHALLLAWFVDASFEFHISAAFRANLSIDPCYYLMYCYRIELAGPI